MYYEKGAKVPASIASQTGKNTGAAKPGFKRKQNLGQTKISFSYFVESAKVLKPAGRTRGKVKDPLTKITKKVVAPKTRKKVKTAAQLLAEIDKKT